MGILGDLFGFVTGGAAAAAGAGINAHNKKKRWNEYQAKEQAKLDAKIAYANALREAEDAETKAARRELERLIGTTIEEDQKRRRYYNLPLEYELAMKNLNEMFERYKSSHPPGSSARVFERKFESYYSHAAQRVLCDYQAVYHETMLPYTEVGYKVAVERAFWQQSMETFKGPSMVGNNQYVMTFFVGPGMYALGQARKELIKQGYLPSNCRSHLWVNWSPYVRWLGELWNDEFHTAVDIGYMFDSTWGQPHPERDEGRVRETQKAYERQHPEHFSTGGQA